MHACDLLGYWLPQAEATLQKAAKKELEKAHTILEVQGKVARLLGLNLDKGKDC